MRLLAAVLLTTGCFAKPGFGGDDAPPQGCQSYGAWGAPVKLASLSDSTSHEFGAWLSPDRTELWFSRYPNSMGGDDHLRATRAGVSGEFGAPSSVLGLLPPASGTPQDDAQLVVSDDGLDVYFDTDQGSVVIAHAHRDQPLGPFHDVGPLFPAASFHRGNATLSSDGLVLVDAEWAMTDAPAHLAIAERGSTAEPFPEPRTLLELESSADDRAPSLSADGLTIVFASDRDTMDYRLYISSRPDRDTMFDPPQLVPMQDLTHEVSNLDPTLSRDGLALVFSSAPNGAFHDLYEMQRACLD